MNSGGGNKSSFLKKKKTRKHFSKSAYDSRKFLQKNYDSETSIFDTGGNSRFKSCSISGKDTLTVLNHNFKKSKNQIDSSDLKLNIYSINNANQKDKKINRSTTRIPSNNLNYQSDDTGNSFTSTRNIIDMLDSDLEISYLEGSLRNESMQSKQNGYSNKKSKKKKSLQVNSDTPFGDILSQKQDSELFYFDVSGNATNVASIQSLVTSSFMSLAGNRPTKSSIDLHTSYQKHFRHTNSLDTINSERLYDKNSCDSPILLMSNERRSKQKIFSQTPKSNRNTPIESYVKETNKKRKSKVSFGSESSFGDSIEGNNLENCEDKLKTLSGHTSQDFNITKNKVKKSHSKTGTETSAVNNKYLKQFISNGFAQKSSESSNKLKIKKLDGKIDNYFNNDEITTSSILHTSLDIDDSLTETKVKKKRKKKMLNPFTDNFIETFEGENTNDCDREYNDVNKLDRSYGSSNYSFSMTTSDIDKLKKKEKRKLKASASKYLDENKIEHNTSANENNSDTSKCDSTPSEQRKKIIKPNKSTSSANSEDFIDRLNGSTDKCEIKEQFIEHLNTLIEDYGEVKASKKKRKSREETEKNSYLDRCKKRKRLDYTDDEDIQNKSDDKNSKLKVLNKKREYLEKTDKATNHKRKKRKNVNYSEGKDIESNVDHDYNSRDVNNITDDYSLGISEDEMDIVQNTDNVKEEVSSDDKTIMKKSSIKKTSVQPVELTREESRMLKYLRIILPSSSVPVLHDIKRPSKPTVEEHSVAKENNAKVGSFTKEEDDQIRKNWESFCKEHSLSLSPKIFFKIPREMGISERVKFLQYISYKLDDRIPFNVHLRFKRLFRETGLKLGRFTQKEDKQIIDFLKSSNSKYKYQDLGRILNRDPISIERRVDVLTQSETDSTRIEWSVELCERLIRGIFSVTGMNRIKQLEYIMLSSEEWSQLSKIMDGIPVVKLQRAWLITVHPKLFLKEHETIIKKDLIKLFLANKEDDLKKIDWKKYADHFYGINEKKLYSLFQNMCRFYSTGKQWPDFRSLLEHMNEVFKGRSGKVKRFKYKHGELHLIKKCLIDEL